MADTGPIPDTEAGRDARAAELLELLASYPPEHLLAGDDPRHEEMALARLELTRIRQPEAEALALEYQVRTLEILIDPRNVTDEEVARIAEMSNPNSPLSTFGQRLLAGC